ncbi:MAG: hypothetical protein FWE06_00150 [Oscillospiraceae bacterium]|nr:hypothetical protein [Oscillospiraceae bacterium]
MYYAYIDENKPLHDPSSDSAVLYRGQVTLVLNAINDFRFSILQSHPLFDGGIEPYRSRVTVMRGDAQVFCGRIIDCTQKMGNDGLMLKEYIAECELAYLLDSVQDVQELHNSTAETYLKAILKHHNRRTNGKKKIKLGTIDIEMQRTFRHITHESSWQNVKNLVNELGGYVKLRYDDNGSRRLDYLPNPSTQESDERTTIELAVNLQSIQSNQRPEQSITRIVPLGMELDNVEVAIRRLELKGVIRSPEWWLYRYHREGGFAESSALGTRWVGRALIVFSESNFRNDVDLNSANIPHDREAFHAAIASLSTAGVVNNPDYWKTICTEACPTDCTHGNLRLLFCRVNYALDIYNPRSPLVDAPRQRLTMRSLTNDKRDWLPVSSVDEAIKRLVDAGLMDSEESNVRWWRDNHTLISNEAGRLMIMLSLLNYSETPVRPSSVDRQDLFDTAVDRLARIGAITAPNFWKTRFNVACRFERGLPRCPGCPHDRTPPEERCMLTDRIRWLIRYTSDNIADEKNAYAPLPVVEKALIFDDVSSPAELVRQGSAWSDHFLLPNSVTISALDLSLVDAENFNPFEVGNTYRAKNHILGINAKYRLIEQQLDIVSPIKSSLIFGDRQASLSRGPSSGSQSTARGAATGGHDHNAADITAGTLTIARIPIGETASTVSLGNHTHTAVQVGAVPTSHLTSSNAHTPANVGAAPAVHVGSTGAAHGSATVAVAGFMSSADKAKLDGVANNANNFTHPAHTARNTELTGGQVYSNVTVDAQGHTTGLAIRNLTAANIGAATTANLTAHTGNTTVHITAAERTRWNNTAGNATAPGRPSTIVVAAHDARQHTINAGFDFRCGSTNAHTQINQALQAAGAGGKVYLSEGTYNVGNTLINIPENVTLVGAGKDATVLNVSAATAIDMQAASQLQDVRVKSVSAANTTALVRLQGIDTIIERCVFDGNTRDASTFTTRYNHGVFVNTQTCRITDCFLGGFRSYAIHTAVNQSRSTIRTCHFTRPISITGNNIVLFGNNFFQLTSTSYAIRASGDNWRVQSNNVVGGGLFIAEGAITRHAITGNTTTGTNFSIMCQRTMSLINVSNNSFSGDIKFVSTYGVSNVNQIKISDNICNRIIVMRSGTGNPQLSRFSITGNISSGISQFRDLNASLVTDNLGPTPTTSNNAANTRINNHPV